jgi:hypothetical protein
MPAAGGGGEILLVAHTRLSLGYVLDHYRLLRHGPGLRFTLTRAPDQYPAGVEEMMDGAGLRRVPYCAAVAQAWDLALSAPVGASGLAVPASTDPGVIAGWLAAAAGRVLVTATYDSAHRLDEALRPADRKSRLVVCARRTGLRGRPAR